MDVPLLLALLLLVGTAPLVAQTQYTRQQLTIPMRDGIRLGAIALVPADTTRAYPIILIRTPFSAANTFRTDEVPLAYRDLAEDGYIFVVEDMRGRFSSEGDFVTLRAPLDPASPKGINESTDAWDTVDWLTKNLRHHNGRVGVLGMSYPGLLAGLGAVNPHPAIKAISPQAPMADAWMGDDFFHQGAFRQTQGVTYAQILETDPKVLTFPEAEIADQYAWYLQFPTLDSLARAARVRDMPIWKAFVTHPTWDSWWQQRSLPKILTTIPVPLLWVGGTWDAEDMAGPQVMYRALESKDRNRLSRLVLGPWSHGQWRGGVGDSIGALALGSATGDYFRREIQRPWFAWYLHGKGSGAFPEAWVFETNGAGWKRFDRWPPVTARARQLYLHADGVLSFQSPATEAKAFTEYRSDPANPVPFVPQPITDESWPTWMLIDQRFLSARPDVVSWRTEPLAEDLVIAGDVMAKLFASTTGSDADWVVKLIDEYPVSTEAPAFSGYQLIVNADVMRGRYRRSFTTPEAIAPAVPVPYTIDLHQQSYRFRKGHRIMVQVQSSWFPLYDRNPQTFVPNIFAARANDYRAQNHRIWQSARYPSSLTLTVLPGDP